MKDEKSNFMNEIYNELSNANKEILMLLARTVKVTQETCKRTNKKPQQTA